MWFCTFFNEVDASLQVEAEVDEGPFDAFSLVLLLLQDEHVVVEKLLQFLIGEVECTAAQSCSAVMGEGGGIQ